MAHKTLIIIAGSITLTVAALFVAPHFINWNEYKSDITEQISQATGRDIAIDGTLNVRILPTPAMTVRNVRLANLDGAGTPDMVRLEALQVRVALMPLLSGEVQVERIRLLNPVINLERMADGRANWDFAPPGSNQSSKGTAGAATPPQGVSVEPAIRLDHFEIVGGTVIYSDAKAASTHKIENLDATLQARSLSGPFQVVGSGRYGNIPVSFETTLGNIIEGRTVSLNTVLMMPGATRINLSGAIVGLGENPRFKGTIEGAGDNLAGLLSALGGSVDAPGLLSQPFSLHGELDASQKTTNLENLEWSLGNNRLSGEASLKTGDNIIFTVDLKAGKIDLDQWVKAAKKASRANGNETAAGNESTVAAQPPSVTAKAQGGGAGGFRLPENVSGNLNLHIDAVAFNKDLINAVELKVSVAKGALRINQAKATLPGVTEIALQGVASAKGGVAAFKGEVSAVASAPEALAAWLGVIIPKKVAGRVRQVSYRSDVHLDAEKLTLSKIKLNVDRSRISGGITYALRKRPSFGASIQVDSLNLDSYLGHASLNPATNTSSTMGTDDTNKPNEETTISDIAGAWAALRGLNAFDANTSLRMGSLRYGGNLYRDLAFNATLYAGELKVREATLGDYAGATASLKGAFNGFGGIPEMSKVSFNASAKDAATLGAALGNATLPSGLGAMKVSGRMDGSILKPKVGVDVNVAGASAGLDGQLSLLPMNFGFNGTVNLRHKSPVDLPARLGLAYLPRGPLGVMDISAKLKTTGKTHTVSSISGVVDGTSLAGNVTVDTAGKDLGFSAELQLGEFYPEHFMARTANENRVSSLYKNERTSQPKMPGVVLASWDSVQPQLAQAPPQGAPSVHARWSREPLGLAALETLDGEVTLKVAGLHYGDAVVQNANIHATAANGILTVDRIDGALAGGTLEGDMVVRARANPANGQSTISGKVTARNVDAAKLVADGSITQGRMNADARFIANGISEAELVSALSGNAAIQLSDLIIKKKSKNNLLSGITGAFDTLQESLLSNPFLTGGKKTLASVDVALDIAAGRGTITKGQLVLPSGAGQVSGTVDFATWNLDVETVVVAEANPLAQALLSSVLNEVSQRHEFRVRIIGPLDDPKLTNLRHKVQNPGGPQGAPGQQPPPPSDGGGVRPSPQPAPGEAPMQTPPQQQPATEQQPQQPVDPRQQRREAVEELFKGLILGQ